MDDIATAAAPEAPANEPNPSTEAPVQEAARDDDGPSLADELSKVWEDAQADPDEEDNSGLDRDERGRFKSKSAEENTADTQDQQTEAVSDEQPEAPAAIEAPASWSAEKKAIFSTLPSEAQEYIAQREQESHKAISELGQTAKSFQPLAETFQRHHTYLSQTGMHPVEFVERAIQASHMLDSNPRTGLEALAKQYGIDLAQTYGGQQQGVDEFGLGPDPVVENLKSEIENLKQQLSNELNGVKSHINSQIQAETTQRVNTAQTVINDFAKDHPDFESVQADIQHLVPQLRQANPAASMTELLQQAYDRAIWANPETRQKQITRQQQDAEAKRVEEAKKHAEQSRKMKTGNVSTAKSTPNAPGDLRATLAGVWDRAHAT